MSRTFSIRAVNESDIPDLAEVHIEAQKASYAGIVDQNYLDSLTVVDRMKKWRDWLAADMKTVRAAVNADNKVVGFVSFGPLKTPPPHMSPVKPTHTSEIYAIYIHPAYWRKGMGTALMKEAVRTLRAQGHKSLCLWVVEQNKPAINFYKGSGAQKCGSREIEIGPTTVTELCYGWRDSAVFLEA